MATKNTQLKDKDHDYNQLKAALPFLLAGLEGHTDGIELLGISLQRGRDGDYRVVLRGNGATPDGHPLRVVAFTNGEEPADVLICAEEGYRDNLVRWHVDRFAKGVVDNGKPETGKNGLTIIK